MAFWLLALLGPLSYIAIREWGHRDRESVRWQVGAVCALWTAIFAALAVLT